MRTILTAFIILFVVLIPLPSTAPAGAQDAIAPLAATIARESQVSFNFSLEPIQTFPGDDSVNLKSALKRGCASSHPASSSSTRRQTTPI